MTQGEIIAVSSGDDLVRWFASQLIARSYGSYRYVKCSATRKWFLDAVCDVSKLKGRSFVWNVPRRSLKFYERDFVTEVLSRRPLFVCVLALECEDRYLLRVCTKHVQAKLVPGGVEFKIHDFNVGEWSRSIVEVLER